MKKSEKPDMNIEQKEGKVNYYIQQDENIGASKSFYNGTHWMCDQSGWHVHNDWSNWTW